MRDLLPRDGFTAAPLLILTLCGSTLADDPFADGVSSYVAGEGAAAGYDDAATAIGPPERFTGEGFGFPGVVSPFSGPFGTDEIVSIGTGGELVVTFDPPIVDDPRNPYGVDLLLFSNNFFIDDFAEPGVIVIGWFAESGLVEVSADGVTWTDVTPATGLFPAAGYRDSGAFDTVPGRVPTNFTRPVDPALTVGDFLGLDLAGVMTLYGSSGGGNGIDIAPLGAPAAFVRVRNLTEGISIEIDAAVDASPLGDVNQDGLVGVDDLLILLGAWGTAVPGADADLNRDGVVDVDDLLTVLGQWNA